MDEQGPTKKERADARRQEKEAAAHKAQSTRQLKKTLVWAGGIAVVLLLLFWGFSAAQNAADSRPGTSYPSEGREHIELGDEHVPYQTNPPTSGPHAGTVPFGVYSAEIPDENAVHNLEHGGIWISYKDLSDDEVAQLEAIARKYPRTVLLSPRSGNDHRISVASWQRLMHLDTVDVSAIEDYIRKNVNKSPEPIAG